MRAGLRRLDVSVLEDVIASGASKCERMLMTRSDQMMRFLSENESVRVTENIIGCTENGRK
jgi:hypothetical protein